MLPQGLGAELIEGSWEIQPIFKLMEEVGKLARKDMYNIFNMGIGMVAIVPVKDAEKVVNHFNQIGEKASVIGKVTQQEGISTLIRRRLS